MENLKNSCLADVGATQKHMSEQIVALQLDQLSDLLNLPLIQQKFDE